MRERLRTGIELRQVDGILCSADPDVHLDGGDIDERESMMGYWTHRGTFLLVGHPILHYDRRDRRSLVLSRNSGVIVGSCVRSLLDNDLRHCDDVGEVGDVCVEFSHNVRVALCECAFESKAVMRRNQMGSGRCVVHAHDEVWNGIDRIAVYRSVRKGLNVQSAAFFAERYVLKYG